MSPRERVARFVNRSKWGVLIVAHIYVIVGLYFMYRAAMAGQVFNAVLGLLFVAGTLGVAMLLHYLLGIAVWWISVWEQLSELRVQLCKLDRTVQTLTSPEAHSPTVDVAASDPANAHDLVAATVNRDSYPRLVEQMTKPAGGLEPDVPETAPGDAESATRKIQRSSDGNPVTDELPRDVAHLNLYRQWRMAVRRGDVGECRKILSAWRDVAAEQFVARRTAEFNVLVGQTSRKLRDLFSHCLQQGRYVEALEVGDRILRQLPSSRIARDFQTIKPHLQRRASAWIPPAGSRCHRDSEPALAER